LGRVLEKAVEGDSEKMTRKGVDCEEKTWCGVIPSFLPSFPSALQLRMSFGLLNNPLLFFSTPRLIARFLNNLVFTV
jgi:hypothetical protein